MLRWMPDRLTIAAMTHGRVLVRRPSSPPPWAALIGFHGYSMNAGQMIELLEQIPGAGSWLLVSVQALHRFYSRDQKTVVASWMTSEDRDAAIADNIRYVADVVDAVKHAWPFEQVVYAGFSQGVAMAFRAAVRAGHACEGVLALGGDIPPELVADASIVWPRVVLGRGDDDAQYTAATFLRDASLLEKAGALAARVTFAGGHDWSPAFCEAAGEYLATVAPRPAHVARSP
jgi:predicted esterase